MKDSLAPGETSNKKSIQLFKSGTASFAVFRGPFRVFLDLDPQDHGRRNFKDTNPLMSSLLVIFVWGGEAIL
jgi:hypothetical protein